MDERITWRAILDDGSIVAPPASSDAVDRDRIRKFQLIEVQTGKAFLEVGMPRPQEQRLVYRARKDYEPGVGLTQVCHLVGVRERDKDTNIWVIDHPGQPLKVHRTEGYDKNHGLFYPPVFRPQEQPWAK